MKRALCLLFALLALAPGALAGEPSIRLKAATLAPKRVGWSVQVEEVFDPAVSDCSHGNVAVKVYYGGIMGDDEDVIRRMREGVLQIGGFGGQGTTMACPEFSVVSLPFLMNDYAEADHLRAEFYPVFRELCINHGFFLALWVDQGFDDIYSVARPMEGPASFRGARVLTWYGRLEQAVLASLGAEPVLVDVPEGAAAIRGKKADAMIAPAIWMLGGQAYSSVRYITPTPLRYSPATVMVSLSAWEGIPQGYRDCIQKRRPEIQERFNAKIRQDNEKCLMAMFQYGVRRVTPSTLDLQAMKARTRPVWDQMAGVLFPRPLLDQVTGSLESFRRARRKTD